MSLKSVVIKYGGSLLDDPNKEKIFLDQIAQAWKTKQNQIILVHGGGKEITRQMEKAKLKPNFINGRRYTDSKTMEVVKEALSQINKSIVQQLKILGVEAKGYSGKENNWLKAGVVKELGQVGIPTHADRDRLQALLSPSILPVFYSVGEDSQGKTLNINADDFAMVMAIAVGANELIFLTDTGGVLDEAGKLIPQINHVTADRLIQNQTIAGGMAVKIQACFQAISKGVGKVIIGEVVLSDGQGLHVVNGTTIVNEGSTITT